MGDSSPSSTVTIATDSTLEILRALSRYLVEPREVEEIVDEATRVFSERLPRNTVRVWLSRPTAVCGTCPQPRVCEDKLGCLALSRSRGATATTDDMLRSVPLGEGLVGLVGSSRHEVVAPSIAGSDSMEGQGWARNHGFKQFMGFPLISAGRLFGVLGVYLESGLSYDAAQNLRMASQILSHAVGSTLLMKEQERHSTDLAEKIEAKTAELKRRVADLEVTRSAMVNMMADAYESHRQLRELTSRLELLVEERTKEAIAAKEDAERANKMKSQFLSRVSHELRTPMHGIMSFAKMGIRKIDRSDQSKNLYFYRQILESADELLPIINDLLDVSRIEAGQADYDFESQSMLDLLDDISKKYEELMRERQVRLYVTYDFHGDTTARFDRKSMRQVVTNLLGNAMKFTAAESTVALRARRLDETMVIEVADEGPGIPDEELDTIFESFVQSSATREGPEGTGLGLSIARGITRDHGGDVTAENRAEGGALFRLILPVDGPPVRET